MLYKQSNQTGSKLTREGKSCMVDGKTTGRLKQYKSIDTPNSVQAIALHLVLKYYTIYYILLQLLQYMDLCFMCNVVRNRLLDLISYIAIIHIMSGVQKSESTTNNCVLCVLFAQHSLKHLSNHTFWAELQVPDAFPHFKFTLNFFDNFNVPHHRHTVVRVIS